MEQAAASDGKRRRPSRGLSRDAVVTATIELLDERGERGFTFRALTEHLRTGPGAVYWHVDNRDQLLDLACDRVLAEALSATVDKSAPPVTALRLLGTAVFDQLDRHSWAGPHLTGRPGQHNVLRILERIGHLVQAAGVPDEAQFHTATAIMNYVLGVGTQMARAAEAVAEHTSRDDFLAASATRWQQLDSQEFPFLRRVAAQFAAHDDREQFLTGLDLLLSGITQAARAVPREAPADELPLP